MTIAITPPRNSPDSSSIEPVAGLDADPAGRPRGQRQPVTLVQITRYAMTHKSLQRRAARAKGSRCIAVWVLGLGSALLALACCSVLQAHETPITLPALKEGGITFRPATTTVISDSAAQAMAQGVVALKEKDYMDARKYYEQTLAELDPSQDSVRMLVLVSLIQVLHELDEYSEVIPRRREELAIVMSLTGDDSEVVAYIRTQLATECEHESQLLEAESEIRAVVEHDERLEGPTSDAALTDGLLLAEILLRGRQFAAALPYLQRVVIKRRGPLDKEPADIAIAVAYLGLAHAGIERQTEARGELLESLPVVRSLVEGGNRPGAEPLLGQVLFGLGLLYLSKDTLSLADGYLREEDALPYQYPGREKVRALRAWALAQVWLWQGNPKKSEARAQKALKSLRDLQQQQTADYVHTLLLLAIDSEQTGREAVALLDLQEALEIAAKLPNETLLMSDCLVVQAQTAEDRGDWREARKAYEGALRLRLQAAGADSQLVSEVQKRLERLRYRAPEADI